MSRAIYLGILFCLFSISAFASEETPKENSTPELISVSPRKPRPPAKFPSWALTKPVEQDGLRNPPLSRGGEQTYEVDTSLPGRISRLQSGVLQRVAAPEAKRAESSVDCTIASANEVLGTTTALPPIESNVGKIDIQALEKKAKSLIENTRMEGRKKRLEEALDIGKQINSEEIKSTANGELGYLYLREKKYEKAISHYQESLKFEGKGIRSNGREDFHFRALVYLGTGEARLEMPGNENLREAESSFRLVINSLKGRQKRVEARAYAGLGEVSLKEGKYGDAQRYFERALIHAPDLKSANSGLELAKARLAKEERESGEIANVSKGRTLRERDRDDRARGHYDRGLSPKRDTKSNDRTNRVGNRSRYSYREKAVETNRSRYSYRNEGRN